MRTQWVELGERSYPIYIGDGILEGGLLARHLVADRALLVSNETVAPLYAGRLAAPGVEVQSVTLRDGERYKTLQTCEQVFDALIEGRFDRSATVVALGGGVIGDLAGFCAATYQRGVGYIQVPTTLLAQVDSSVGGKTGVNHPRGKNMIGAFHQPRAVIADTGVLATLPEREYNAGLAEVVKYGLIRDPAFFDWLEGSVDALRRRDPEALAHAVAESCRNKAEVVAADEREAGERALLNLGHTFGHAIETETDYSTWLHGEAVAVGMVMAARMSVRLGWLSRDGLERTTALLEAFGLPTQPPAIPEERFRELMSVDKKNRAGRLRLVLLRGVGDAVVTSEFAAEALTATLAEAVRAG
ncbi:MULTISPECIES: 3-dehydroquinate synthase [unclassified Halorhodospira]|uniref:3-dehydroquinate synthase n=1 Tax=unclassified Halorhodospira TaxID=2626748 RepID=UPI001EE94CCF|nr:MULTISPECIES: 3-dehydroquinate synthase [unclassified Halorhodospira]MCG5540567.1 3-dehydroquinate synthase [Halorhodospira sp. M39old]MCG5546234.1 3-dehydroquinate synthase [Halorhodospira sp. M38]